MRHLHVGDLLTAGEIVLKSAELRIVLIALAFLVAALVTGARPVFS
jgi:hypothetical protein